MKIIYFDLPMGGAGDMLSAALFELLNHDDQHIFLDTVNNMGLVGVHITAVPETKKGIQGTKMHVLINDAEETPGGHVHHHHHAHHHDHELHQHSHNHAHEHSHSHTHEHSHTSMHDIEHIIMDLKIDDKVKKDAINIYKLIATAESKAHGTEVSMVHFHEVGMLDAIADVVGCCLLINMLAPKKIISSPIHIGSGTVHCAHGIMPVPAPAVAHLIQDIPVYSTDIKGELLTPTGAAIIKYFTHEYGPKPIMKPVSIGYGMGTKDFDLLNASHAILATIDDTDTDTIIELSCNMDDMTGEEAGFAIEALMTAGARDAFYEQIIMKKSRPGLKLTVITTKDIVDDMVKVIFKHTTTIGIRACQMDRYVLNRKTEALDTEYGTVNKKISTGYNITREKWEYDDISRIAKEKGLSLSDLKRLIEHH